MAAPFITLGVIVVVLALRYVYKLLLPEPIPGIPYNAASAKRFSGDTPTFLADFETNKEVSASRYEYGTKADSPIFQFFKPLCKPQVFVNDPREAEDILLRRSKEFDRGFQSRDTLGVIMPHCTIVKQTTPEWKNQRRLWIDAMAPDFLRRVLAPRTYQSAMELVDYWKLKSSKENGQAFDVTHDFDTAALDAIWLAVLGDELGGMRAKMSKVHPDSDQDQNGGIDMLETVRVLDAVATDKENGTLPFLSNWALRKSKDFQKYNSIRGAEIDRILRAATARFQRVLDGKTDGSEHDTCAMDLVLRRRVLAEQKSGIPMVDPTKDAELRDELMLLLWAGHDTTSCTLSWFVKYMTNNPQAQTRLRRELQRAFPGPGMPSASEIIQSDIPYLDGTIEEASRLAAIVGRVTRIAKVDTHIFGRAIPAGSEIVMNVAMTARPPSVPEHLRSPTCQAAFLKLSYGGIDGPAGDDLPAFRPERWLVTGADGKEAFDSYALPRLSFGNGTRGCFGRKLALQELRIMITLITLNLEFDPLPEKLNSMEGVELLFRKPEQCYVKLRLA